MGGAEILKIKKLETMGRSLTAEKQHENALKSLLLNANASDSKANSAILVGQQVPDQHIEMVHIIFLADI